MLFSAQFDFEILNAPFSGGFVRVEEYVKSISTNNAASVEHFYDIAVFVSRDNHFSFKRVVFRGGYESVPL